MAWGGKGEALAACDVRGWRGAAGRRRCGVRGITSRDGLNGPTLDRRTKRAQAGTTRPVSSACHTWVDGLFNLSGQACRAAHLDPSSSKFPTSKSSNFASKKGRKGE